MDIDLEKFFDNVAQDKLMSLVHDTIKNYLKRLRLNAGQDERFTRASGHRVLFLHFMKSDEIIMKVYEL